MGMGMGMEILQDKRVIFLDIETTGLNFELDRIIELGVIEFIGNNKILEYSRLFSGGKSPAHLINNVHGIKDSERQKEPSFEEQADKVAVYLSNSILVGHNIAKFDLPMIEKKLALKNQKLQNIEVIDTYLMVKKLKVASLDYKLGTLCKFYNVEYGNHRGLQDAKSVKDLLVVLMDKFNIKNIDDMKVKR